MSVRFGSSTGGFRSGFKGVKTGQTITMAPSKPRPYDKKQDKKIRKLNKFLKAELRQRLTSSAATALTQAGTHQLLNGMIAGDVVNTREGTKINMINCNYNIEFAIVQAQVPQAPAQVTARVVLIYDARPNGAIYSLQDIFNTGGTAGNNYMANRNWNFKDRFRLLYDRTFHVGQIYGSTRSPVNVATTYNANVMPMVIKIRKRLNKKTFYNSGVVGDVTDIVRGSLYLAVMSDVDATWVTSRIIGETIFMP